jgi:hypothetical protein
VTGGPEWLVNVNMAEEVPGTGPEAQSIADMWRVEAGNGTVYDRTSAPVTIR